MNTPIFDFVNHYKDRNAMRLHMPGHKGKSFLGIEAFDITEITGADTLYSSNGIIEESQKNAAALFGTARTIYSCEGTSLSIRAMLYLALLACNGSSKTILAARNAHKVFMSAAALLDFEIEWFCASESDSIISCEISCESLDKKLSQMEEKPAAFYVTSPDYLGNIADIASIAQICHKHGVLLLCDNAHGAYLHFLPESKHPITLGADICCDSAHKTLPVLTGGGYLHISKNAPDVVSQHAKRAMALFASTSPSYLIMQSLDLANLYLSNGYKEKLADCIRKIDTLKNNLKAHGFILSGCEALKLTVMPKSYGYTGIELADYLAERGIICEFCDRDFIVFMFTPEIHECEIERLEELLVCLPKRAVITEKPPVFETPRRVMSARQAIFSCSESIFASQSSGRVLASENVSCPPAIPIAVSGEEINEAAVKLFEYYGIDEVTVIKC